MYRNSIVLQACVAVGIVAGFVCSTLTAQEKKPPKVTYDDHVKPILRQKCFSCHNQDKTEGDLNMTNYTSLMQGGGSGPVVEPGNSSGSYLYSLITHQEEPYMPPESPKLPDTSIETIRKWIDGGVLENAGSKAQISKKPKFNLALKTSASDRPAVVPMPCRLSLEPVTHTKAVTAVSAIATSPWAPVAAIGGQKQILLYHTKTLELLGTLAFPEGIPHVIKFSRNGSLLLAGGGRAGASGRVVVWNIHTGERVIEVGDELDAVLAADISSDQTLIALGGPQKVVRIYSTETGRLLHELRKHTDWIYSLEFSPDSVLLASGDRNGGVFVWEGWTGREYLTLKAHSQRVTGLSWRSDSNVLASASEDGSIRLWEMENGGQIKNWTGHGGGVASIEFARDGKIVSCGRDRTTKLWDQNGSQQRAFEAFSDLALQVSYCDETNRVVAGDWTGAIRVWNADGKSAGQINMNPPTLAERLELANRQLAQRQATAEPLMRAFQAAQQKADELSKTLAAVEKQHVDAQQRSVALTERIKVDEQSMAKTMLEMQALTKKVDSLDSTVAALQEAAKKATQAAAQLKEDQEIAAAAEKIVKLAEERARQLSSEQGALEAKNKAVEVLKRQLGKDKTSLAEMTKVAKAATVKIETLKPNLKPTSDAAEAARETAEESEAAVAQAREETARWQREIAFTTRLKDIGAKILAAREELGRAVEKQQTVQTVAAQAMQAIQRAKAQVATATATLAQAQDDLNAAVAKVKSEAAALQRSQTELQQAEDKRSQLDAIVPVVTEALAKTSKAAEQAGNEKSLNGAADLIKTVLNAKKIELEAATKDVAARSTALTALKQKLAVLQKVGTAMEMKAQGAVQAMQQAKESVVTSEAAYAKDVQGQVDATSKAVAAAQKAVEELRGQLAQLRTSNALTTK